jgi:hypothetical protein
VLLVTAAVAAGCHSKPPSYRVQGRIVYQGSDKPFALGWVCLECTQPPYPRLKASLNENGEFALEAPAGEHRVCLEPGEAGATRAGMAAYLRQVDKKYLVYATAEWKVTVVPHQENNFTLYVTKPGAK